MDRRKFIGISAATTAGVLLAPKLLKAKNDISLIPNDKIQALEGDNVLIIIELFGGNDGLNTIIPAEDSEYHNLRKNIGFPDTVAIKVNDIYMNPALVEGITNEGLKRMFEDGRLAIIEGIGYDSPNMSHFRSEDIWLSGINPKTNNNVRLLEGWLGRYFALKLPNFPLEIPEHPLSIAIDGTIPLLFKSDKGHMGIALTDPDEFYELGKGLTPLDSMLTGSDYYTEEYNFVHAIARQSEVYSAAVKNAFDTGKNLIQGNVYSPNTLSQKLKLVASLIAGGLKTKVYYMKISNFDSHAQQANSDFSGQHFTLLNDTARAITEFMEDAAITGFSERVTGMTISEFGRRTYENGSRGTDHGAASMQFIWGNDRFVNGGYWNNHPNLSDLDINGNVKYQTDYRVIYSEILEKRFYAATDEITQVFGESFLPLNVLEKRTSGVEDYLKPLFGDFVRSYPNPGSGSGVIAFEMYKQGKAIVNVYNLNGKEEQTLHSGYLQPGYYEIPFRINKSGTFIGSVSIGRRRYTTKFVVIK
ncbi:MAG: DUF1501 domain-containing protein [Bacteroidetes bacterium]|nr:MAG: DUF1501 domain-containing protein [Bacteroidota bacterium]